MSRANEFDLIRTYFASGYPKVEAIPVGIGDDCSIISPTGQHELAQSIDTQIANVHFPECAPAHLIAERALRCAVSDLVAMGAQPHSFHLALTLPNNQTNWLESFAIGLRRTAQNLKISLIGGDTTRGSELVITIAVQGWLPKGSYLRRSNAQEHDDVWVTGKIGAAALILPTILATPELDNDTTAPYYRPSLALDFGLGLPLIANSAIDISDGLLQDLAHIASASQAGIQLYAEQIPTIVPMEHSHWPRCLTGGDDYVLAFTAGKDKSSDIHQLATECDLQYCRKIGIVTNGQQVEVLDSKGHVIKIHQQGYQHF